MKKYININGKNYIYYYPSDYYSLKQYESQIKRVKEKIRATEYGCYKGTNRYNDYPELLLFLEKLI